MLASLAIEALAAAALLGATGWGRPWRGVAAAMLATLLSHPLAWGGISLTMPSLGYWPAVLGMEALVALAEAPAWRLMVPLPWRRALLGSLVVNALSTAVGLGWYAWEGRFSASSSTGSSAQACSSAASAYTCRATE
jgi:hypothetical protein